MINTVADLKKRTLAESNILKSLILSASEGSSAPTMDDILIHDYQIANSTTLNSIFVNYIVGIKWALRPVDGSSTTDSYFQIVNGVLDGDNQKELSDQTRLVLTVDDGNGQFHSRQLGWTCEELELGDDDETGHTIEFVNLDQTWYGKRRKIEGDVSYDFLHIVPGMNSSEGAGTLNPFLEGGLDHHLVDVEFDGGQEPNNFNEWLRFWNQKVNCIVENMFYRNEMQNGISEDGEDTLARALCLSRYIVCASDRLYGLQEERDRDGGFVQFVLHDIGACTKNLDQNAYAAKGYEFITCSFHSIADQTTMFVVFRDADEWHYAYLNESSFDQTYGFTSMQTLVTDQTVLGPSQVFSKVQSLRDMSGDVTIALTDYGFWDIEPNQTNETTYSFRGAGRKDIEVIGDVEFNGRKDKLIDLPCDVMETDRIVEYDRKWVVDEDGMYECRQSSGDRVPLYDRYLPQILGNQQFVGGSRGFAVYDSIGSSPVTIFADLGDSFVRLLYSSVDLRATITQWLYEQVTCHEPVEYGEYYLYSTYATAASRFNDYVTSKKFTGLQCQMDGSMIVDSFSSVKEILGDTSQATLQGYCTRLKELVSYSKPLSWVVDDSDMKSKVSQKFINHEYSILRDAFVDEVLDYLQGIKATKSLSYFRQYLSQNFKSDSLKKPNSTEIEVENEQDIVKAAQGYLKSKIPASLVIGGYDQTQQGNERYPGISSYITQNRINLDKSDVLDIFSPENVKAQILTAVKSTPFFSAYDTHEKLRNAFNNSELKAEMFKVSENVDFAKKTDLVDDGGCLKINQREGSGWAALSNWLFSSVTSDNLLKALIKTQIYRPLFFDPGNHINYTSDSEAYSCTIKKRHVRFDGKTCDLKFQDETWEVDAVGSGLGNSDEYDIDGLNFSIQTNVLEYKVEFKPIQVVNGKFVHEDVEYYLTKGQNGASLYFNEFQKDVTAGNDWIQIEDGKFSLNGKTYTIDGDTVYVDAVVGFDNEYACSILDSEQFSLDGVDYVIEGDRIRYASVDDNRLIEIPIDENGYGMYEPWRMEFKFDQGYEKVTIIHDHQTTAIDQVVSESCEFDGRQDFEIADERTFDWWFAHAVMNLMDRHPSQFTGAKALGNGVLYDGGLLLDNQNGTGCSIRFENMVQEGYVVTKAFLRKRASGNAEWSELPLGVVFDKDMNLVAGMAFRGDVCDNLVNNSDDGSLMILLKDVHGGKNDVNAVWTENSTWDANVKVVEKVGSISDITPDGSDLSEFSVYFNDSLGEYAPTSITISQLHSDDMMYDGMLFEVKTKSDGSQKYSVLSSDSNHMHVIVDGVRYRLNLNDRTVDAFLINTMSAATIDFSTQYDRDRLIDGLTSNIKQAMMNQIVQTMADNGNSEEIDIQTKDLDLYLDLFSDEVQAHNLGLAQSGIAEQGKNKFIEVYKNSLEGISEDGIPTGKAYGYLNGKVAVVFGGNNSIELVDEPSFEVQRVNQRDEFTYRVLLDLSFNVKKEAFTSTTDKTHIIGNATVHDIECDVKLTPEFAYGSSSTGTMTYTALYFIKGDSDSKTHNATYDQIIYRYENKVRTRSVPTQSVEIRIPASTYSSTSTSTEIQNIVNEIVSGKVGQIFSKSIVEAFAETVNDASGHESLQIAVVDTKNKYEDNGVWRLDAPHPSMSEMPDNESIIDIQRGKTIIDGKTYYVSGDDRRLIQEDGSDSCDIVDIEWHEWNVATNEYSTDLVSAKVAVMNQIVSNADLVSNFTPSILPSTRNMLDSSLSEVYLNFISDRFSITSIGQMSLDFSDVKNLDGHNQRFYEKFGFMPSSRSNQDLLVLQRAGDSESSVLVGCRLDDHDIEFNYDVEMYSISMQTKPFRLTGVPYENDSDVVSTSAYSWTGIEGGFDVQLSNLNSSVFTKDIQVGASVVWMSSTPAYGWVVSSIIAPDPSASSPMRMVEIASGETHQTVSATELQVPQFSIGDDVIVRDSDGQLRAGYHIVGIGYNDGLEYALEDSANNSITALESDLIRRYGQGDQVIWRKRETDQSTGKTSVKNMGEWEVIGIDDTTSPITYSIGSGNKVETASIDDVFPKYATLEVLDSNRTPGITFNFIPYYDSEEGWKRLLADYATFTTVDSGMLDYKNIDVDYSSQLNDEGVLVHRLSYRFRVPAAEDYKILGIVPPSGKAYVDYDIGILVSNSDDTYDAVNVLGAFDFKGHPVDDLPYCFTQYPTNLNSDQVEDMSDLEYKRIYVELDRTDDNQIVFSGDGKRCPFTVQAISPDASLQIEGDIYDRYYLVEERVMADHVTSANFDGNVILDNSGTAKTIRTKPTRTEHQDLTDDVVPESMSEAIETLVFNETKLSTAYFDSALTQLKNFLELLESELNGKIDKDEMAGNCMLKYTAEPKFKKYSTDSSQWNQSGGMFNWQRGGQTYRSCLGAFNGRMQNDFYADFSVVDSRAEDVDDRSYCPILNPSYEYLSKTYNFRAAGGILNFRQKVLEDLSQLVGSAPSDDDIISQIFGSSSDAVRYINVIDTDVKYPILKMYVADRQCHLFVQRDSEQILWYRFPCSESSIQALLESKVSSGGGYVYSPSIQLTDYPIVLDDGWCIRAANRDFTTLSSAADAYVVHMKDGDEDLWWLSSENCHIHSPFRIQDMAYEQFGRTLYVVFEGDNHIYSYRNISNLRDSDGKVQLLKENAEMKIETFPTIDLSPSSSDVQCIYLDYQDPPPGSTSLNPDWTISLFGVHRGLNKFKEVWSRSPGIRSSDFLQYNTIIFGDTLFSSGQLRFQNVSKNKDMYDMLDVRDIDHFYYGLFRNESDEVVHRELGHDLYTVFRTDGVEGGNVQRLPFEIVSPTLYTTSDELYSLYALTQEDSGEVDSEGKTIYHPALQEISVPNSPLYADRRIDIYDIIHRNDINPDGSFRQNTYDIHDVIMTGFKLNNTQTSFFVLADQGFYKIGYENIFSRISIDTLAELKDRLNTSLKDILQNHIEKYHLERQKDWFEAISNKINQFDGTFSMFDLIPTEFRETQDVGVIPDSKVDDTDETTDHRVDSIQVSTDILQTQGMVVDSDSNPGIITAAVSNPATIYDDDNVFTKSQRNPLIEGTEFYDYIYDQDGNALMDLYGISFIYQVNSNNTYDLYINIPTTRTKYLNRVAGTLKSDLTSQVLAGDSYQRRNFLGESLPNNLDESTTRLKVFIDRKYISVGNVELVEICGNSIPLQIYRDSFNDGLYDSIALESRWNGEVEEIVQPEKDINKVALEFECYGTDSQSIHIQGKTLIHHSLDDSRYEIK